MGGFRTDNLRNDNLPLQNFGGDEYDIYFAGRTGIGNGNYPAFPGIGSVKTGVDSYFQAHKIDLPAEYQGALQALSEIKIGRAFGRPNMVHISVPWNVLSNLGIEYLCFSGKKWDDISSEPERTYYALITDFATVNSNSTRVSFAVDYVASYWDMLDMSTDTGFICPIERQSECFSTDDPDFDAIYTSQQTDGLNLPNITYKYDIKLSKGGGDVEDFNNTHPKNTTLETITRSLFDASTAKVSLQCMCNVDGNLDGMQMNFQSGSSVGGFLYSFYLTGKQLPNFINNVIITFSRSTFTMGQPLLAVLRGAYLLPQWAANNCSPISYKGSSNASEQDFTETEAHMPVNTDAFQAWKELSGRFITPQNIQQALRCKTDFVLHNIDTLSQMLGLTDADRIQNNKLMNYITYSIRTHQQEMVFTPFSLNRRAEQTNGYGRCPVAEMVFEMFGGATGCMKTTLLTRGYDYAEVNPEEPATNYNVSLSPYSVSTASWPTISFMGTQTDGPQNHGRGRGDKGSGPNPKTGNYDVHYHPGWGDKHANGTWEGKE